MKRMPVFAVVVFMLTASFAAAQIGAMIRGVVTDEAGAPVPDVKVEIRFAGGHDLKPQTFTMTTNKKGYFTRVGLPDGSYKITLTKEGYAPTIVNTNVSLGGLSDLGTMLLRSAKAPTAAPPADPSAGTAAAAPGPAGAEALAKEQERFKQTFTQALEAAKAGKYDEAETLYKDVLAKAPNLGIAHYNLAYVYRQKKDWTAAEAEYRKVIELEPDSSDGYIALAGVLQAANKGDEAAKTLSDASARFQQDAKFRYALAVVYYDSGKRDEAIAAFKQVRMLDPANPEPLYFLGVLAVQAGDTPQALTYLNQYVSASGQNPRNLETAQGLLKVLKK
jgi:Flp pilus assembly protein TadD